MISKMHLTECNSDEFSCDISRCIPISQRCDNQYNCDDRTDEEECPNAHIPETGECFLYIIWK